MNGFFTSLAMVGPFGHGPRGGPWDGAVAGARPGDGTELQEAEP
jgi:hypothetical protein